MIITDEQKKQVQEEGFVILESIIPRDHLDMLRDSCNKAIAAVEMRMDASGNDVEGINHRGKRYFEPAHPNDYPEMQAFYFSELNAEILRAALGDNAFLFLAQFTVKCGETGMSFAWHQDSGYVGFPHKPTVNLWCALDDMSEENGTLYLLPYSRAGTRELVKHELQEGTNDAVGYFGDDPGDPLSVPAGTIVAFSSLVFHRSGPNTLGSMRRALTVEFSPEPMLNPATGENHLWAMPFLKAGKILPWTESALLNSK